MVLPGKACDVTFDWWGIQYDMVHITVLEICATKNCEAKTCVVKSSMWCGGDVVQCGVVERCGCVAESNVAAVLFALRSQVSPLWSL